MNPRPEQLLKEVQHLRQRVDELSTGFKIMAWLAITGWTLVVGLMAMVPV